MNGIELVAVAVAAVALFLWGGLWIVDRVQGYRHRRSQKQDLRWRR